MSKTLKIIFTVSIILNVLLSGAVGGVIYKEWRYHPWHEIKKELSPEAKNLVARSFQQGRREAGPSIREAMSDRRELVKILEAKEFDAEKFQAKAEELQKIQGKLTDIKIEATLELARELSYEDRKKLAENIARTFSGRKFHENYNHPRPKKSDKDEE